MVAQPAHTKAFKLRGFLTSSICKHYEFSKSSLEIGQHLVNPPLKGLATLLNVSVIEGDFNP